MKSPVEPDRGDNAGALGRLDHELPVGPGRRERLLQVEVATGSRNRDRQLRVKATRGGDDDRVEIVAREQLARRAAERRTRGPTTSRRKRGAVGIGQRGHHDPRGTPQDREVHRSRDRAAPDHSDTWHGTPRNVAGSRVPRLVQLVLQHAFLVARAFAEAVPNPLADRPGDTGERERGHEGQWESVARAGQPQRAEEAQRCDEWRAGGVEQRATATPRPTARRTDQTAAEIALVKPGKNRETFR